MGLLPNIGYPQTGDEVDAGMYVCMNCEGGTPDSPKTIILNKRKKLPKCPVCGIAWWMKI